VEKEYNSRNRKLFSDRSLAEVFMEHYGQDTDTGTPIAGSAADPKGAIVLNVIKGEMKFDRKVIEVVAGQPVRIVFKNPDFMQHNLVITKKGALEKVGKAADKLATDPHGAEMQYVPEMNEVLYHTKLVNPQSSETLEFTAPAEPGDYPFVCTFPGHWSIMNGILKVKPKE
jgi:azurin